MSAIRDVRVGELREGEIGLHHTPAHMRPGLSTPLGSKLSFTRLRQRRRARLLRLEHVDRGAHGRGRANQRGVAAGREPRRGGSRRRRRRRRAAARPRSARRPSRRTTARRGRQLRGELGAARRRGRDAPQRPVAASCRWPERRDVAHAAPERARMRLRRRVSSAPNGLSRVASAALRCATDGATPSSRNAVAACADMQPGETHHHAAPADAPPPTRRRTSPSPPHGRAAPASSRPSTSTVSSVSGSRQRLDRHVGHRRERAPGAGEQLAEVVAGDVLHHAAAGLEGLAAARNRRQAEEMIARGAGLDAARAGEVGGERAAERARAGRPAEQRAVIHRLEGELLALAARPAPRSRRAACRPAPRAPVPPARRA